MATALGRTVLQVAVNFMNRRDTAMEVKKEIQALGQESLLVQADVGGQTRRGADGVTNTLGVCRPTRRGSGDRYILGLLGLTGGLRDRRRSASSMADVTLRARWGSSEVGSEQPVVLFEDTPVLTQIQERVINCTCCPRLVAHRQHVAEQKVRRFRNESYWGKPVPSFGDPLARLLIIGLAPAAHGANRTGRAFTGDRSGDWLYEALHLYRFANQPDSSYRQDGLTLHDCFITQVIRCAPPDNRPDRQEIANCQPYFVDELRLLSNVRVVIPLGRLAFNAYLRAYQQIGSILPTPRPRFGHGKLTCLPTGQAFLSSYHPSRQNTQTGRLTRAMFHQVFATARALLDGKCKRIGVYR